MNQRSQIINQAWDSRRDDVAFYEDAVLEIMVLLESGALRVAEKIDDEWIVNQYAKKAILLYFKMTDSTLMIGNVQNYFDKIPLRFSEYSAQNFKETNIRSVPGSYVRKSAYIGKNTILMPSFVNVGAYVGDGTLIDTWATIGSCAQIGKNCHISGGVGVGGVLEPLQANPVIIEDNCFIGARSEVTEGVVIGEGSVLAMGVFLSQSTKIINRQTGQIFYGKVPPYSVLVPGSIQSGEHCSTYAAVLVKNVDAQTRSKTSINDLLRL